jgi:hypothetical protein
LRSSQPNVLAVNAELPRAACRSSSRWRRQSPAKLAYCVGGNGSASHSIWSSSRSIARFDALHVPFQRLAAGGDGERFKVRTQMLFA